MRTLEDESPISGEELLYGLLGKSSLLCWLCPPSDDCPIWWMFGHGASFERACVAAHGLSSNRGRAWREFAGHRSTRPTSSYPILEVPRRKMLKFTFRSDMPSDAESHSYQRATAMWRLQIACSPRLCRAPSRLHVSYHLASTLPLYLGSP